MSLFNKKKTQQKKQDKSIEFSYTEFSDGDGTSLSENLAKAHIPYMGSRIEIGKTLGLDDKPATETKTPYGVEKEIYAFYQKFVNKTRKICKDKLSNLKSTCAILSAKINDFVKHKDEFIKQEAERIRKAREIAERKVKAFIAQKRENLKESILEVIRNIKNLKNEIREIETQLAKDHETKPSRYRRTLLIAILIGLGVLESPMNYKTVLLWRDDIISTLLIATLFSLVIPVAAHAFGSYMKKKSISKKDTFWMIIAIFSALGISWIIGDIRYDYLAEKNIEILSAFGYGFINFVIFLIGSWISYHLSYKNPELVKSLLSHKSDLNSEDKLKDELQNQSVNLESEEARENQKIADQFPEDAETQTNSKLSTLENELIVKDKEFNAVLTAVQSIESLICSYYEEAIYAFRSSNERWRNASNPAYWANPLPPLKTFFSGEKPKGSTSDSDTLETTVTD